MRTSSGQPRSTSFDIVIPTIGRASLHRLLGALERCDGTRPAAIVIADDRPGASTRLPDLGHVRPRPVVVEVGGRGPAAARNAGWRRCSSPWIVFLDDDVVPEPAWLGDLAADLTSCRARTAAVQGRLIVPLPDERRPTDWERNVARLESSAWITADMAVRRRALLDIGGFDERFRRAYREDTDLALRLMDAGWELGRGSRRVAHPVRPTTWRQSVAAQRGNADDALMRRLHGSRWRTAGTAPAGALPAHTATVACAVTAVVAALCGHRRSARCAGLAAGALVGRFWAVRVRGGRKRPADIVGLAASSTLIPFAATFWRAWGWARALRLAPRGRADRWSARLPALVLFDRDGTLIHDVPYNGEPARIEPVDGARAALERLRQAGIAVGIITNQSGVGRGLLTSHQVDAVNRRTEELLGPFSVVEVCPHLEEDGCACRKPAPGMVLEAASRAGVTPDRCAVVGDIGSDVGAALAAGARAVLVPTCATAADEIVGAPEVAASLERAVDLLLNVEVGP
jgi:HAD superfamily hydrolase (TIGR01662 family)